MPWFTNTSQNIVFSEGRLVRPGDNLFRADGAPAVIGLSPHNPESAAPAAETQPNHPYQWLDESSVQRITGLLGTESEAGLSAMRQYEVEHRNRVSVLRAIDHRLAVFGAGK
ncbi:MAG TPA: hypothetical protein DIC36_00950 [Gammaproteobacteria bacterium]|nr:hypothetical protein [Gammaproteobacteria bacterium]